MVTIVSSDGQDRWEKPLSNTDSVLPAAVDFISGDFPPMQAFPMFVREGEVITPGVPVAGQIDEFNNGEIYVGSWGDTLANPGNTVSGMVGIAITGTRSSGAAEGDSILVARQGVFDPDLLTWDPSFSTDADKLQAFDGAQRSPVQIVLRKRIASAP